ncbi:MAG: hypothetical protein R3E02_08360 [Blastomonas sp.]
MRSFLFILLAGLLVPSARATEAETIILKPSSPWQLDYGDERCRLGRYFGTGDQQTVFWLEQFGPGESFDWLVAGPAIIGFMPDEPLKVRFSPGAEAWEMTSAAATLEGFGSAIIGRGPLRIEVSYGLPPKDEKEVEQEDGPPEGLSHLDTELGASIYGFRLEQDPKQKLVLELGAMEKPFAAMNQCVEDLVASWGFDIVQQKALKKTPNLKNKAEIVHKLQRYYPTNVMKNGGQARFFLRADVDEKGQSSNCRLINRTVADHFGTMTRQCEYIEEDAEFEPAIGSDGKPIKSFFVASINYQIGK